MKKHLALMIIVAMLASMTAVHAEDLGVQVIGGPETENTPMSLDDLQLGQSYTIDGYAKIKPMEYLTVDYFAQFKKDADYGNVNDGNYADPNSNQVFVDQLNSKWYKNWRWWDAYWNDSGVNADFAWFMMDITNLQKKSFSFMENASVKVMYQDEYEFAGWVRQVNYDYINYGAEGRKVSRYDSQTNCPNVVVLDPANVEAIDMMYTGTYAFGATLPNSVIEDTGSPLRMVITIDGNELTYNIRK